MTSFKPSTDFETDIDSFESLENKVKSLGLILKLTERTITEKLESDEKTFSYRGSISFKNEVVNFYFSPYGQITCDGVKPLFMVTSDNCSSLIIRNSITKELSKIMKIKELPKDRFYNPTTDNIIIALIIIVITIIIGFSIYGIMHFIKS